MESRQHILYDSEFNKTTLAGLRVVGARVREPRDRRNVRWLKNEKKKGVEEVKKIKLVVDNDGCGSAVPPTGFLILISLIPVPVARRVSVRR